MPTNREEYFKRYNITKDSLSKNEIAKKKIKYINQNLKLY